MGLIEDLHEAQKNATGAAGEAIFSLLSLPHATITGLASTIQGKSFDEASRAIMAKYAAFGRSIGRDQSDRILKELIKVHQKKG